MWYTQDECGTHRMNKWFKAWVARKSVLSNKEDWVRMRKMSQKMCNYAKGIAWGIRSAERRKVNVFVFKSEVKVKCLRNMIYRIYANW